MKYMYLLWIVLSTVLRGLKGQSQILKIFKSSAISKDWETLKGKKEKISVLEKFRYESIRWI